MVSKVATWCSGQEPQDAQLGGGQRLSNRGDSLPPGCAARTWIAEVLEQQTPEVARFMLGTSLLGSLTAAPCAAVTRRPDAAALLRSLNAANLFLVTNHDERTSFRYHHLVRRMLRAQLRGGRHNPVVTIG